MNSKSDKKLSNPSRIANDFKDYKRRLLARCNKTKVKFRYAVSRKYIHPEDINDYRLKQSFVNQVEKSYGTDKATKVAEILNNP